mgnify:CR=1 FL=1
MKNLTRKMNVALTRAKFAVEEFLNEERGDTNFISIAIILVVVLVIAVVFIRLGNTVTSGLNEKMSEFEGIFNK